jgi:PAS domain S-box-containing protein
MEAADNSIFITRPDGTIQWVNPAFVRETGFSAAELLGQNPRILKSKKMDAAFWKGVWDTILAGRSWRGELFNTRKDGSEYELEMTISPVIDEKGRILHFVAIEQDISRRKQAEDQLRASLREISELQTALDEHAIVAVTDPQGKITYVNDKFCALSKYSREELLGQDHRILNSGFHSKKFFHQMWETIGSGRVWHGQVKNRAKDGSFYWVDSTIVPFLDDQGAPRQYVAIRTDVTESKKKEQEISEKARLLDLSSDAILVRDLAGRIQYWNRGAEALYGWTSEEALGKHLYSLLQREYPAPPDQITAELRQTNRWAGELVDTKRDGQRIIVLARKALDRDPSGNPATVMESLTDITERKQIEAALEQAHQKLNDRAALLESLVNERTSELKAANQQLESFVYSIAHDLRAPLRAMQGFSSALVKEAASRLSETSKDYAARINSSAQFMDSMLKALLDISQISQKQIELEPLSLKPVVEGVIDRLQTEIQAKRAQVETPGEWPRVMAHLPTLTQVISNLLGNALKFTNPDLPPKVLLRAEDRAAEFIRIWVEDNGIGIAPEHQCQIFGLFNRLVHPSSAKRPKSAAFFNSISGLPFSTSSGGNNREKCRPKTSSARYPLIRWAPIFQLTTMPSAFKAKIA